MPALAERFGIRPFEVGSLTPQEFVEMVAQVTPRPGG